MHITVVDLFIYSFCPWLG